MATATATTFRCPECGRDDFTRAQSLGAHRSQVHGIKGGSKAAQKRRADAKKTTARKSTSKKSTARKTSTRRRTARIARTRNEPLNRDALLALLYPNGIPPRESALRDAVALLDRAEEIARG